MDARSSLPPAVGIDLGTTYSCLAYVDSHGRPLTLPNAEGELLTPSAVLFDGQEVIVGREAIKALATDAPHVATLAKREMGNRAFSQPVADVPLPPEVIQARVLYKLRRDARPQLGDVRQAVITVPAYFDEVRRRATHDAGYMAGLDVLDILNEPTAAALAFGYQQGFLDVRGAAHAPLNLLVYDLGGGTFDVTVMTVSGRDFITRAIDGDVRLGGSDWDDRLVQEMAELFIRQFDIDPRSDPRALARLVRECEEAKRTLSARSRAPLAFDWQGHALRTEISRERFESLTADLLDRTRFTAKEALRAAGLDWGRIDRVLLVGGSSRMPAVRAMLTHLIGKPPDDSLAADEAVALGAALHAQRCQAERAGQTPPFRIQNVNSHSLGVVATDPLTRRPQTAVILPRNTALPASRRRRFQAQKQGQESLLVQVVEGESASPDACVTLGRCVLRHLPADLPMAAPVDVDFRYASDGLLQVKVVLPGTDAELEFEFQRPNSLSRAELFRWRQEITGGD